MLDEKTAVRMTDNVYNMPYSELLYMQSLLLCELKHYICPKETARK